jgi:hypothetical protein
MLQQAAPRNNSARRIYLWLSIRSQKGRRAAKARGRSREPPVFARFGPTSDETKVARVAGDTPERLPSRLCEQTGLVNVPTSCEDDGEDDYDFGSSGRRANLSGLVTTKTSLIRPWLTFTETTENGFPCR